MELTELTKDSILKDMERLGRLTQPKRVSKHAGLGTYLTRGGFTASFSATKRRPWTVRAERRSAGKRARLARKANR